MLRGSIDGGESCCKGRRGDADSYFGPSAGGKGIATLGSVMDEVYACPCRKPGSRLVGVPPSTEYKMFWKGGVLLAVAARNTSRTCPRSGHVAQENHKTQAKFERVEFGTRTTPMSSA